MKIFAIYGNKTKKESIKDIGHGWTLVVWKEQSSSGEEFVSFFKFTHKIEGEDDFEVVYMLEDLMPVAKLRASNREGMDGYRFYANRVKKTPFISVPKGYILDQVKIKDTEAKLASGTAGSSDIFKATGAMSKYSVKYAGDDITRHREFKEMEQVVEDQHKQIMAIDESRWSAEHGLTKLEVGDIVALFGDMDRAQLLMEVTEPVNINEKKSRMWITGVILATPNEEDLEDDNGEIGEDEYKEWLAGKKRIERKLSFGKPEGDALYLVTGGADKYKIGKSGVDRTKLDTSDFEMDFIWGSTGRR